MKLQCKICRSFNLKCEDDQIVCNECGCKYSIEEAKNLINKNLEENTLQEEEKIMKHEITIKTEQESTWNPILATLAIIMAFIGFMALICNLLL